MSHGAQLVLSKARGVGGVLQAQVQHHGGLCLVADVCVCAHRSWGRADVDKKSARILKCCSSACMWKIVRLAFSFLAKTWLQHGHDLA